MMLHAPPVTAPPTSDKRWKIVETVMRRNDFEPEALIESLHSVQQSFGYLDEPSMRWVAGALHVPLSKVYAVATFYHFFSLKPQGRHTCVVCLGTACYIKGGRELLDEVERHYHVQEGKTTEDGELSVMVARCIGACGLAPTTVLDGQVLGRKTSPQLLAAIDEKLQRKVTS
ncbi:MAG: bidirectional hydrogenase complex protein HoxE [Phycisphaerales bacterium]|nr:bidirectional hydrogenase complex protein HoxE [Phycisphaerales bacterium]